MVLRSQPSATEHGTSPYFSEGKAIEFGLVQFVKPEKIKPEKIGVVHSQIRLRFTPGRGKIYGPHGRRIKKDG